MKLNIEGAKFPVLLSKSSYLLQRLNTILVLYHCDLWGDNMDVDMISHLESSGFDCSVPQRSDTRGWILAARNNIYE